VSSQEVSIRVPATSANLGPGFDSFGMALALYNRFNVTPTTQDAFSFSPNTCVSVQGVSSEPGESLPFRALERFYQEIAKPRPTLSVEVEAHIPLARGLGSSSSAIVAGLMAGNELEGHPLSRTDLVRLATELEGHPDNVAPAILGGVVLCDPDSGAYSLPWPEGWQVLVVVPEYQLLTEEARRVLPKNISQEDAIFNLRKASLLTYALFQRDEQAFRASLEDRLHQPYRAALIPEFQPIRALALQEGAFGAVMSGAGPSVAVFYSEQVKENLVTQLNTYKEQHTGKLRILQLALSPSGAYISK
jgi:homoserine kinase